MNLRALTLGFAITITLTSVLMAAVGAQDRGGSSVDQLLMVALSVCVTLLVHFLPSLTRNKMALIVWGLCMSAALFNHLNFFVHSAERAEIRRGMEAESSIKVRGLNERIADVTRDYTSIDARTETEISHSLVLAKGWKLRSALNIELAEARRKTVLSNQLAALKLELAKTREMAENDVVTSEISRVAGISPITANVSIGLLLALLVELSGAILWFEILHGKAIKAETVSVPANQEMSPGIDFVPIAVEPPITPSGHAMQNAAHLSKDKDVNTIMLAIRNGECRATAASIRALLKCRTSRAAELNRMVKGVMHTELQAVMH